MGAPKIESAFESILRTKNDPVCPTDSMEKGPLDSEIISEELKNGSYVLRQKKRLDQTLSPMKCWNVLLKNNRMYFLNFLTQSCSITGIHRDGTNPY